MCNPIRKAAVIDDAESDRSMMTRRLTEIGYEVNEVVSPSELDAGPFEVALIDMVFCGDLIGPTFCQTVSERWPSCLIVAVSAVDKRDDIFRQALERGACAQVEKGQITESLLRGLILGHGCRRLHP